MFELDGKVGEKVPLQSAGSCVTASQPHGTPQPSLHASLHASEYDSIITLESWQVELSPEMQRAVGYTVSSS